MPMKSSFNRTDNLKILCYGNETLMPQMMALMRHNEQV